MSVALIEENNDIILISDINNQPDINDEPDLVQKPSSEQLDYYVLDFVPRLIARAPAIARSIIALNTFYHNMFRVPRNLALREQGFRQYALLLEAMGSSALRNNFDLINPFTSIARQVIDLPETAFQTMSYMRSLPYEMANSYYAMAYMVAGEEFIVNLIANAISSVYNSLLPSFVQSVNNTISSYFYDLPEIKSPYMMYDWVKEIFGYGKGDYEHHLKSHTSMNNPKSFNGAYNWLGPGTLIGGRIIRGSDRGDGYPLTYEFSQPINELDELAFRHDLDYSTASDAISRFNIDKQFMKDLDDLIDKIGLSDPGYLSDIITVKLMFGIKSTPVGVVKNILGFGHDNLVTFNNTLDAEPDEKWYYYKGIKPPKPSTKGPTKYKKIINNDWVNDLTNNDWNNIINGDVKLNVPEIKPKKPNIINGSIPTRFLKKKEKLFIDPVVVSPRQDLKGTIATINERYPDLRNETKQLYSKEHPEIFKIIDDQDRNIPPIRPPTNDNNIKISTFKTPSNTFINMPNPRPPNYVRTRDNLNIDMEKIILLLLSQLDKKTRSYLPALVKMLKKRGYV